MVVVLWIFPEREPKWQVSSYLGFDTPFGDGVAAVCAAMKWREQEWEFLFPASDGRGRIAKDVTPRELGFGEYGWLVVDWKPAEANN